MWRKKVNRQSKYLIIALASVCIMAFSGCGSESVSVKSNQKLVYGEVEQIVGNEVILSRKYEADQEENIETQQNNAANSASDSSTTRESNSSSAESQEATERVESQDISATNSEEEVSVVTVLQLPVGMTIHRGKEEISFTEIQEGEPLKILMEKDSSGVEVPIEAWIAELTDKEKKQLEKQTTTAVAVEQLSTSAEASSDTSETVTTTPSETSSIETNS